MVPFLPKCSSHYYHAYYFLYFITLSTVSLVLSLTTSCFRYFPLSSSSSIYLYLMPQYPYNKVLLLSPICLTRMKSFDALSFLSKTSIFSFAQSSFSNVSAHTQAIICFISLLRISIFGCLRCCFWFLK